MRGPAVELRATEAVRAALTGNLAMHAGATRSSRAGADATTSAQRQAQAGVDLSWRLRTGTNIKLSQSWGRSADAEQPGATSRGTEITVAQPLLKGASRVVVEAGLQAAQSTHRVATRSLGQTAQSLAIQALGAYLAVQQAQDSLVQARQALGLAMRLHEFNQALVAAGRSPRAVLLQSEADVASARLTLAQEENQQRQSVRLLAQTMGRGDLFEGVELTLSDTFARFESMPLPPEQAFIAVALQSSADLLATRELVLMAELALAQARDNLLPSLAVTAGRTLRVGRTAGARVEDWMVSLDFEYTLDRAPLRTEVAAAQQNLELARAQLEATERLVVDTAADALRTLGFAMAQHRLSQTRVALVEKQLEAEVTRQSLGRVSQFELSNAQQSLAAARRQLLDSARQVFRARLELMRIDGSLLPAWEAQPLLDGWLAQGRRSPQE